MKDKTLERALSQLSVLLYLNAATGAGYKSPTSTPITGMIFSSALPSDVVTEFQKAEKMFDKWHRDNIREEAKALDSFEEMPAGMRDPETARHMKKLKEKLSGRHTPTWTEDQTTKSALVELIKKSYYNSITFFDEVGARLSASLASSPGRLASDLSWVTLMEGTTDSTLIRANSNGGALIHSLAGSSARFNYFCKCHRETALHLIDRIKNSISGRVITGKAIVIPTAPHSCPDIKAEIIFSLLKQVFARGAKPETMVDIRYAPDCYDQWVAFENWGLSEITNGEDLGEWEQEQLADAPANPKLCVLNATRAVINAKLLEIVSGDAMQSIVPGVVELSADHLVMAKRFAQILFEVSSGIQALRSRLDNLVNTKDKYINGNTLRDAKIAIYEHIAESDNKRVSRKQTRCIEGVTFGLVDALVESGDLYELVGKEVCQMGNTTRAYVHPNDAPPMSEEESVAEFTEAEEMYAAEPDSITLSQVIVVYRALQVKADEMNSIESLPVVPISRMTKKEIRILPAVIDRMKNRVLLRGVGRTPEPEYLLNDEYTPLDVGGLNLWVRHKPDSGAEFHRDWSICAKLELAEAFSTKEITEEEFAAMD